MHIETERLILIPYTRKQLRLAIMNPSKAADEIGALYLSRSIEDTIFQSNVHRMKLRLVDQNPELWLFSTAWQMVFKENRDLAGEVGFKGYHASGEVEIGYSTHPKYRNKGIMTEAVRAICEYAYSQTDVDIKIITASTKPDNLASERVLLKNGFERKGIKFRLNYWEKQNDSATNSAE